MTPSLQARSWKIVLRLMFRKHLSIAEHRARGEQTARLSGKIPPDVKMERVEIDGVPAAWILPINADSKKVILHMHGGGYVTGGSASHLMMCIPMAQTLKMNMLLPDYRLAPEHPFPAALDDALNAYRWLLSQGHQAKDIIISGDSAGGGLALATVLSLRDGGEPLPAAVICFSPWADLTHAGASHTSNAKRDVVLTTALLQEWALAYTDENNFYNPLVSPIHADFHGFPPLFIQVDDSEILLDDARTLAGKARAHGVKVVLKTWSGLWHVWHALGSAIPETQKAFEEIKQFLDIHTPSADLSLPE
jgi:epsilon-lactone hydrolase